MMPGGESIQDDLASGHLKKGQTSTKHYSDEGSGYWRETTSVTKDSRKEAVCASCGRPAAPDVQLKTCSGCRMVLWVPLPCFFTRPRSYLDESTIQVLFSWTSKSKFCIPYSLLVGWHGSCNFRFIGKLRTKSNALVYIRKHYVFGFSESFESESLNTMYLSMYRVM